jgi:hypothetical protein
MSSRKPTDSDPEEDTVGYRSPALDEARAEIIRLKRQASSGSGEDDRTRYYEPDEASRRVDPPEGNADRRRRPAWPARDRAAAGEEGARGGDDRTRLYKAGTSSPDQTPPAAAPAGLSPSTGRASDDPVVGWLVVIKGPGKGRSLEIGVGANSIGRDSRQKLRVDFGDKHVSRDKHAILIYEPKTRKYFIQNGDTRNLTYIGSDVVLNPTELLGGEVIVIGETHLSFVPFDETRYS